MHCIIFSFLKVYSVIAILAWASGQLQGSEINNTDYDPPAPYWNERINGTSALIGFFAHEENLTRVYEDEVTAVYFDSDLNKSTSWMFPFLSRVSKYVNHTYGPLGQDPHIYYIFHGGTYGTNCHYSLNLDRLHDYRNTIDCSLNTTLSYTALNSINMAFTYSMLFGMIRKILSGFEKYPDQDISHLQMQKIGVYDIYLGMSQLEDALQWKKKQMREYDEFPHKYTFWFRDWFYPIYSNYGGAPVLKKYLQVLGEYLPHAGKNNGRFVEPINYGEFVHFWSEAAGTNLKDLATTAFGEEAFNQEFIQARIDFPNFNYTDSNPSKTNVILQLALIIGPVVGGAILLLMIVYAIFKCFKKWTSGRPFLRDDEIKEFLSGRSFSNTSKTSDLDYHADIFKEAFNMHYILSREMIKWDDKDKDVIGSGHFSVVHRGFLFTPNVEDAYNFTSWKPVAIKMIKSNVDILHFKALVSEVKIMAHLESNPNVVQFFGAYIERIKIGELCVAMELCENGALLEHLRKQKVWILNLGPGTIVHASSAARAAVSYVTLESDEDGAEEQSNSGSCVKEMQSLKYDLLHWCLDIANGLAYLSSKNVIHGDLAARNILLTKDNVAKLSDFGLSRQLLNDYSVYTKKSMVPVPWKWMALESLLNSQFSPQSDVWSYGVTVWEIFSLGDPPYPGFKYDGSFTNKISSGYRLPQPSLASEEIYTLMTRCWEKDPKSRIEISSLCAYFQKLVHNFES